jgi:hypothetical protein
MNLMMISFGSYSAAFSGKCQANERASEQREKSRENILRLSFYRRRLLLLMFLLYYSTLAVVIQRQ